MAETTSTGEDAPKLTAPTLKYMAKRVISEFTRDGTDTYYTLRVGETSTYGIMLTVPEGTMADYSPGEWIAMIEFI